MLLEDSYYCSPQTWQYVHVRTCTYTVCIHNSLIFRYSGFSTDGEIDRVRLVGPNAPQTYRGTPYVKKKAHRNTQRLIVQEFCASTYMYM